MSSVKLAIYLVVRGEERVRDEGMQRKEGSILVSIRARKWNDNILYLQLPCTVTVTGKEIQEISTSCSAGVLRRINVATIYIHYTLLSYSRLQRGKPE